ncbi:hypothetical protein [Thalassospira lucentensis]|uniref:hypothetical protein n=1 Tax=Thalassospira lucentensis TaxID=168935 RepID=UPI003AA96538
MNKEKRVKEIFSLRHSRAQAFIYQGMPAHTLPSARTFVREAPADSQRRILNRVKAENLIELWERMETPDFFTKRAVLALFYEGWNPYVTEAAKPLNALKKKPNNDEDDEGLVKVKKPKQGPVLGD